MFGVRKPSLKRSFAAKTSLKRQLKQATGIKMPKAPGWVTDPNKYARKKVYNKTTVSFWDLFK